jgi:tripartite-type tricarboxylate transporter receptor subunit TctC
MQRSARVAALAALSVFLAVFQPARAADPYPAKPVRLIIATGVGGFDDFSARQLAAKLSEVLGQQFIPENRPGAGGMIAQTFVARSAPDGYTLLLAGGSMTGAKFVNANIGYDLQRDFTPISQITEVPFVLMANPALPAANLKEFIALARSQPGRLTFGTLGAGQIPYWAAYQLNGMAGIRCLEVQYKNPSDVVTDIITGRLDFALFSAENVVGQKDKMRLLGVTTRTRSHMLPDVPTLAEAGLPGYDMPAWQSIMGPARLPPDVVQILNRAIVRSMASPEVRERFLKAGVTPVTGTPEELRKQYETWTEIFGKIAKDVGVKPH